MSKDPNVCDKECIYILTDPHIDLPGMWNVCLWFEWRSVVGGSPPQRHIDDDDSGAESEPDLSELILIPEDSLSIQGIYEAIKQCQELNPDPADVDDDDDENLYEDAEEENEEMYIEAESEHIGDAGNIVRRYTLHTH